MVGLLKLGSWRHTLPVLNYLRRQYLRRLPACGEMLALKALRPAWPDESPFSIAPFCNLPNHGDPARTERSRPGRRSDQKAEQYLTSEQNSRTAPSRSSGPILVLDPDNVDALGNLGVLLYFHGEYGGAIPQLQAALKLNPGL